MQRSYLALAILASIPVYPALAEPTSNQQLGGDVVIVPPKLQQRAVLRYPPEAGRAHGDVAVRVSVDTEGAVVDATVVNGPEVFHAEAMAAATTLRFQPARAGDVAVASTAVVRFHFAPPLHDDDDQVPDMELVVHGDHPDRNDPHSRTTLDEADLAQVAGADLATAASQVAGVTLAGGTAAVAKPIIRGMSERRLLLRVDGIRHASQKWGPDHAPEIDPFAAGSIGVIKGAAGARYGPEAMGGVLLVDPPPMRTTAGVGGRTWLAGQSNGWGGMAGLRLDLTPTDARFTTRFLGDYARTTPASTPDHLLGNTGSETWNLGTAVATTLGATTLRLTAHHHELRAGVYYGVATSTPDAFRAQLDAGVPPTADLWDRSLSIDRPYQHVRHDTVALHADTRLGEAVTLEALYALQINHRREYEQAREAIEGPQYDFVLRTQDLDLALAHRADLGSHLVLSSRVGVQGSFQENLARGLPLVPNHRTVAGGAWLVEHLELQRGDLEVGVRYDRQAQDAYLEPLDHARHVRRGTLDPDACTPVDARLRCATDDDAVSLTLGGVWHLVPRLLDLKGELSRASRFPQVDERYLVGTAPSFPVVAWGTPSLGVETTWGASGTVAVEQPWIYAELGGFAQRIDDYIQFAPVLGPDGQPAFETTIRGAFPLFGFDPIAAAFVGADGRLELGPQEVVGLELSGATVHGTERGTGEGLVGVPADRGRVRGIARPRAPGELRELELWAGLEAIAKQGRVDPDRDLAPPPDGALLLSAGVEVHVPVSRRDLRVAVEGRNLTNQRYREYTSLMRYYADMPGRDVRLRLTSDF